MSASRDELFALASASGLRPGTGESEAALRARVGTHLRREGFVGSAQSLAARIDELASSGKAVPVAGSAVRKRDTRAAVAYRRALSLLAERHADEFAATLRELRVAAGLPAESAARQPSRAELLAEVERLRAQLAGEPAPTEQPSHECSCGRRFVSRQALGGHRGKAGCR